MTEHEAAQAIAKLDACVHCHGTGREPGLIPLPDLENLPGQRAPREHTTAYTLRALKRWLRDQSQPARTQEQL